MESTQLHLSICDNIGLLDGLVVVLEKATISGGVERMQLLYIQCSTREHRIVSNNHYTRIACIRTLAYIDTDWHHA